MNVVVEKYLPNRVSDTHRPEQRFLGQTPSQEPDA